MTEKRLTVSFDPELVSAAREAAEEEGQNLSTWLADAARRRLSSGALLDVVAEFEALHGAFAEEELAIARKQLGK